MANAGSTTAATPDEVVAFWRDAGPTAWFAKSADFDRRFRERFLAAHEAALRGELDAWAGTPVGALALVILLDQFPRNAFRGSPRAFAADAAARAVAHAAVAAAFDRAVPAELALFFYIPFGHSENGADQERSVQLAERVGEPYLARALRHREIIRRFGRFPHRNAILGRATRPDEQAYLDAGGFAG